MQNLKTKKQKSNKQANKQVQWLGLGAFIAEGMGLLHGGGTSHMPRDRGKKKQKTSKQTGDYERQGVGSEKNG